MKRAATVLALAMATLVFVPQPALAAPDARGDAAALFREGQAAFVRKNYRAAALAFEEANRRAPTAAAIYNAAIAWRREGAIDRAADDFAFAIADPALVDPERADAVRNLAELEKLVGSVEITGPANTSVTVGHVVRERTPLRVHLTPGDYPLSAVLPSGTAASRTIHVRAAGSERVDLDDPRAAGAAAPAQPPPSQVGPPPPAASADTGTARGMTTGTVLGIGSLALAGLATGASIFFGVRTLGARDDYESSGYTDPDARDRTLDNRTLTNVSLVAVGVFAITGVVLLLTQSDGTRSTAIR